MARFCPLFSGSSGNVTYIGCASGGILIDAGVGARSVVSALTAVETDIHTIEAVFITHEHSDHIRGLSTLVRRHGIRVYASFETASALRHMMPDIDVNIMGEDGMETGGLFVQSFPTSHDCAGSSGYVVDTPDGRRIAVCTDLGHVTDEVRGALTGCDLILLESNHDVNMLKNGGYPYYTKLRILSDKGHLSNACCADELPWLIQNGTTRLILGHISRENNFPELALATAKSALASKSMAENVDYTLSAARPAGGRMMVF